MSARIAVFNHSPQLLRLFQVILGQQGFEVSGHIEDVHGVEAVRELQPDLIILGNLTGVGLDEWHTLTLLRAQAENRHTPIIIASTGTQILTGTVPCNHQDRLYLLPKPFDRQTLLDCVYQALEQRNMHLAGD